MFLLATLVAFGSVSVTSREQFKRLRTERLPIRVSYNFDRAYLEVAANNNCPAQSKAFFFFHVSKDGDVESVRGSVVALSANLKSVALGWASTLLMKLQFKPLLYGTRPSPVDTTVTVVCSE